MQKTEHNNADKPPVTFNKKWIGWMSVLGGIVLWELFGRFLGFRFLPPFTEVIVETIDRLDDAKFWQDFLISMRSLALGYGSAVIIGVLIGGLIGAYRAFEYMFEFYVEVLLATPKLIFAPIMLSLFGAGRESQIALIVLFAIPIIIVNTTTGVRTVKQSWVQMAKSFGASERQIFTKILLPGSAPLLLLGLSLGLTRAVKGMVAGEMFIAVVGIGAQLRRYGSRFDVAGTWSILVIIVLFSVILLVVFNHLTAHLSNAGGGQEV
jgi:NitT/TauT family transport system permease protein